MEIFEDLGCGEFINFVIDSIIAQARASGLEKAMVRLDDDRLTTIMLALSVQTGLKVSAISILTDKPVGKESRIAELFCQRYGITLEVFDSLGIYKAAKLLRFPRSEERLNEFIESSVRDMADEYEAVLIGLEPLRFLTENQVGDLSRYLRLTGFGEVVPVENKQEEDKPEEFLEFFTEMGKQMEALSISSN